MANNAGIAITGVRDEDFDLGIAVNLKSAFLCTEACSMAVARVYACRDQCAVRAHGDGSGHANNARPRRKTDGEFELALGERP